MKIKAIESLPTKPLWHNERWAVIEYLGKVMAYQLIEGEPFKPNQLLPTVIMPNKTHYPEDGYSYYWYCKGVGNSSTSIEGLLPPCPFCGKGGATIGSGPFSYTGGESGVFWARVDCKSERCGSAIWRKDDSEAKARRMVLQAWETIRVTT